MTKEADFLQRLAVWMDNRCNVKRDTTKSVLKHSAVREHVVVIRTEPLKMKKEAQSEVNKPQVPCCLLELTDKNYYYREVRGRVESFDQGHNMLCHASACLYGDLNGFSVA